METDELRKLAADSELSLNYIAKDEMLSKALFMLQGFEDIVLKGGTAINRVYLNNKRFSEDIDFDLIFGSDVKKAIPRTKEIISKISGFEIAAPRIMNETIRYDLYYVNPLGHRDKIRLEFKVVKKASGYKKRIVNFGYVPFKSALMNVYDVEILIKHKIGCIMSRLEGKDFFDLFFLLEAEHKPVRMPKRVIERISLEEEKIKAVANVINHYIPKKERPNWTGFLEELKGRLEREV